MSRPIETRVHDLLSWLEKQRLAHADMVLDAGDASIWCKEEAERIEDHAQTVIDLNELRAAVKSIGIMAVSTQEVFELLDRLEDSEQEKERLLGLAHDQNRELVRLREECRALRAKIVEMEQQEPVAWMLNCQTLSGDTGWILSWTQSGAGLCNRLKGEENEKRLYAHPGARGEEK